MGFTDLLIHRATIMRRSTDLDRMGQPTGRWTAVADDVPCRVTIPRGGERNTERMRETYGVSHRVFVGAETTDTAEDDEIVVVDQDGREILPQARIVLRRVAYAGGPDPHHIELDCQALRGPQ